RPRRSRRSRRPRLEHRLPETSLCAEADAGLAGIERDRHGWRSDVVVQRDDLPALLVAIQLDTVHARVLGLRGLGIATRLDHAVDGRETVMFPDFAQHFAFVEAMRPCLALGSNEIAGFDGLEVWLAVL